MTDNTESRQFAFGMNEIDDCECPAVAAGHKPGLGNGDVTAVAEKYDEQVKNILIQKGRDVEDRGTVHADVAKKAWNDVIRVFEYDVVKRDVAVRIAKELGWR